MGGNITGGSEGREAVVGDPCPDVTKDHRPAGPGEGVPDLDPRTEAMLRWLKRLVTGLALVMGLGILLIAGVIWFRLGAGGGVGSTPMQSPVPGQIPPLPASITLPEGAEPVAVTFSTGRLVVVTQTGEVLVFDQAGDLLQRLVLEGAAP